MQKKQKRVSKNQDINVDLTKFLSDLNESQPEYLGYEDHKKMDKEIEEARQEVERGPSKFDKRLENVDEWIADHKDTIKDTASNIWVITVMVIMALFFIDLVDFLIFGREFSGGVLGY